MLRYTCIACLLYIFKALIHLSLCADGRVLPVNHRQTVHPNGTLTVENVQQKADQGTYTCQARNRQGLSDKGSVDITVMGKIHEKDDTFT